LLEEKINKKIFQPAATFAHSSLVKRYTGTDKMLLHRIRANFQTQMSGCTLRLKENIMHRTLQTMVSRLTAVVFFGAILIFVVDSTAIAGARIREAKNISLINATIHIDESISSIQDMRDDINIVGRNAPLVINVNEGDELTKNIQIGEVGCIKSNVTDVGITDLRVSNVVHESIMDISEGSTVANIGSSGIQNEYISLERISSSIGIAKNRQIIEGIEDAAISQSVVKESSEKSIAQINADVIQDNSAIEGKIVQEIANLNIISPSPKTVLIM
jgi:hypothetical protein